MCGIAGLIVPHHSSMSLSEHGKRMMGSLTHRGPDSHGIWVNDQEGFVLAHNRLAIQDLSELGHQPMLSKTGRYRIVFNGEIYNFKELARELKTRGHQFTGHSDTEVLLSAIEEWGLQGAVNRSTGMFAFALWDAKERTLSLCRDRLGEKPLYYGWLENCFCFASELKAIEAITPQKEFDIDHQGLMNYLRYGYISAPYSIYQGIYKLVPGTIVTFPIREIFNLIQYSPHADSSVPGPKTYWSVHEAANSGLSNLINSEEEAIDQLETLLHDTIKMQKIADVGVGVFLSGGIDSATALYLARKKGFRSTALIFDYGQRHKREIQMADLSKNMEQRHMSSSENYDVIRERKEFWIHLWNEILSWEEMALKENEKKVLDAVKILLENSENIEIFNKKAVYLYLREITALNTKQVVNCLNKMRIRYRGFKDDWNRGKI